MSPQAEGWEQAAERRLFATGLALALLAVGVQTVVTLLNAFVPAEPIDAFDAGSDSSAFAWVSSVVSFTAALAVAALAALRPERSRSLLALALILAFWSLDDIVGVHEWASDFEGLSSLWEHSGRLWPLLFLPLLALTFLLLWRLGEGAGGRAGRLMFAGLGLLVTATLLEMGSQLLFVFWDQPEAASQIQMALEEAAELAGWIFVTTALAAIVLAALVRSPSPAALAVAGRLKEPLPDAQGRVTAGARR